jgi:hypothetical protein
MPASRPSFQNHWRVYTLCDRSGKNGVARKDRLQEKLTLVREVSEPGKIKFAIKTAEIIIGLSGDFRLYYFIGLALGTWSFLLGVSGVSFLVVNK